MSNVTLITFPIHCAKLNEESDLVEERTWFRCVAVVKAEGDVTFIRQEESESAAPFLSSARKEQHSPLDCLSNLILAANCKSSYETFAHNLPVICCVSI